MAYHPEHIVTGKTRAKVESLSTFGITHEQIASYLGISHDTLTKYYRKELSAGLIEANERVAKSLYKKATEQDDFQAQKFWLQTRARWKTAESDAPAPLENLVTKLLEKINVKSD
jgi:DNA-binding transcriptional MocR family regulator